MPLKEHLHVWTFYHSKVELKRWKTSRLIVDITTITEVADSKYKSINWLVDKDNDVWWVIAELRTPESDNYIKLLQEQYV